MKLSEAIRLGATLKPQGRTVFYDSLDRSTCALGAALDAIGQLGGQLHLTRYNEWCKVEEHWPYAFKLGTTEDMTKSIAYKAAIMNDQGWTREQVADFVEAEERKLGLWEEIPERNLIEEVREDTARANDRQSDHRPILTPA